ncbi:MAG: flagellar biosynthesis protein [Burkholderiales bacterium]|nr:flagellar biosynthesis protein [Burkholderiales bacterium]
MSKAKERLNVPPPSGGAAKPSYGRFIPKEEVNAAQAFQLDSFGDNQAKRPPVSAPTPPEAKAPPPPPPPHPRELLAAARQAGYQDGLRDGLAALEASKQQHARQVAAQLGVLVSSFDASFAELESQLADAFTRSVVQIAQQVLRSELRLHPDHVAQVAREAVEALMLTARHVRVRVHPDDLPLVEAGAAEVLAARGATLLADATIERGGCFVESDIATVDARIAKRWQLAAGMLGQRAEWSLEPGEIAEDR